MESEDQSTVDFVFVPDAFIPLVLLALSFTIIFTWQVININTQRQALQGTVARQENAVKQSKQIQQNLDKLCRDLIEVSQTDSDAKAIVGKYGIQVTGTPSPAISK